MWINGKCKRKNAGSDPSPYPAISVHLSRRVEPGNWWIKVLQCGFKYKCKRKGGLNMAIQRRISSFVTNGALFSSLNFIFVSVFFIVTDVWCTVHMDCVCVKRFVVFRALKYIHRFTFCACLVVLFILFYSTRSMVVVWNITHFVSKSNDFREWTSQNISTILTTSSFEKLYTRSHINCVQTNDLPRYYHEIEHLYKRLGLKTRFCWVPSTTLW